MKTKSTAKFYSQKISLLMSGILLMLRLASAQCTPPPSGVVAWWLGDGDASDIVNTNNGTLFGGTTFAVGKVGSAFSFNGTSSYIQLNNTVRNYFPASGFTYEFWVQPNAVQSDRAALLSNHSSAGNFWNGITIKQTQTVGITLQNISPVDWVAWDTTTCPRINKATLY